MSAGAWCALITAGCFVALSSYGYGHSVSLRSPVHTVRAMELPTAEPDASGEVLLWRRAVLTKAERQTRARELARAQKEAYAAVYHITRQNMNSYREWWR